MTAKDQPRGCDSPGLEDTSPAGRESIAIVTAAQLRRRRQAAWRLLPLDSGQRDPLDGIAGQPVTQKWECCGEFGPDGRLRPHNCQEGAA